MAGAAMLMLSACSEDKKGGDIRTLADYDNVTAADSLLYYFGQLRAVDYWQYALNDTTFASRESRNQYVKGLRAGLDAARDNDAYNQGLFAGIQIALNMKEFSEQYHMDFNRRILIDAVEDGLENDSAVNASEANQMFRKVTEDLRVRKEAEDRATAIETIAEAAKAGKWNRISETLYAAGKPVAGAQLIKKGETVNVKVEISTLEGKEIDRRNTPRMKVGEGFPGPVTEALLTMKVGETCKFYTTSPEMFGRFAERYGLKPTQVVAFTVSTAAAEPEKTPEAPEVSE